MSSEMLSNIVIPINQSLLTNQPYVTTQSRVQIHVTESQEGFKTLNNQYFIVLFCEPYTLTLQVQRYGRSVDELIIKMRF